MHLRKNLKVFPMYSCSFLVAIIIDKSSIPRTSFQKLQEIFFDSYLPLIECFIAENIDDSILSLDSLDFLVRKAVKHALRFSACHIKKRNL